MRIFLKTFFLFTGASTSLKGQIRRQKPKEIERFAQDYVGIIGSIETEN